MFKLAVGLTVWFEVEGGGVKAEEGGNLERADSNGLRGHVIGSGNHNCVLVRVYQGTNKHHE